MNKNFGEHSRRKNINHIVGIPDLNLTVHIQHARIHLFAAPLQPNSAPHKLLKLQGPLSGDL